MNKLKNQKCIVCGKNKCTLVEEEEDISNFGKIFVFSMNCESCGFSKSDVESMEKREPVKITFEINSKKDMKIRVVKSGNALVKIPQIRKNIEEGSDGFISNIEGLLNKFEKILIEQRNNAEEKGDRKKAKNLLKKLWKAKLGEIPLKIIIEDKSGNSSIISDKSKIEKLER